MRILLLDNIDSFTYNIFHYLEQLGADVTVRTNRETFSLADNRWDAVVLSPGPGLPTDAGCLMDVLDEAVKKGVPVLGICLGMQAIAQYFGGSIYNQAIVRHGQEALVIHNGKGNLFAEIPETFKVGLYHSWAVSHDLPGELQQTAVSADGIMMALQHAELPVHGVQFHPESILSEHGLTLFANFLGKTGK